MVQVSHKRQAKCFGSIDYLTFPILTVVTAAKVMIINC
jgi:hypothetical protein